MGYRPCRSNVWRYPSSKPPIVAEDVDGEDVAVGEVVVAGVVVVVVGLEVDEDDVVVGEEVVVAAVVVVGRVEKVLGEVDGEVIGKVGEDPTGDEGGDGD